MGNILSLVKTRKNIVVNQTQNPPESDHPTFKPISIKIIEEKIIPVGFELVKETSELIKNQECVICNSDSVEKSYFRCHSDQMSICIE